MAPTMVVVVVAPAVVTVTPAMVMVTMSPAVVAVPPTGVMMMAPATMATPMHGGRTGITCHHLGRGWGERRGLS
ncbi:hypothetical protein [Methylobacterium gnaphalii]|uniref:hypothetical protein n=1 Tax=Methylobacterium gnaphalii TaxID=1010610 RepID=UPI0014795B82|nr:hypothetical protein [Methylobacterium gnaphalii]